MTDRHVMSLRPVSRTEETIEGISEPVLVYGGDLLYLVTMKGATAEEVDELRDTLEDILGEMVPRPPVLVANCEIDVEILEVVERPSRFDALASDDT